ncbi:nucleotidyltransferase family protein [Tabrizicola piscis]|uniref:Nucleotidyltransferase family protein n=1 Tax=Tabrizicola piscis TaxID=2494374 RepID=A0A3S8U7C9_9RHOB|nr:nucleotidyltransferase family protein [Tabrizicola piscis]AZL59430.1 nucleotidyltransferase family protein [Tabrizicola piscis]
MFPFPLMIFAAGFGTRMGALTADRPKPLIPVAGRALIDHALDVARGAGSGRVVVNVHYLADQMEAHLAGSGVAISDERAQILETGGGLRAALPLLGPGPVAVLNSDGIWTGANPLAELAGAWDIDRMEALLLLLPVDETRGHGTKGDFRLDRDGRISRGEGGEDHVYIGAQILQPGRLAGVAEAAFSLNPVWNQMIAAGTAYGIRHQGGWCDVGHPEGIAEAERLLHSARHD